MLLPLVSILILMGCYALQPLSGATPESGQILAFDLNDAGRVGLGEALGPELARVEGALLAQRDDHYVIAMRSVRRLDGRVQVWSGERVEIKKEHIRGSFERRFSRGRTIALGVVGVGGLAALVIGTDLLPGGQPRGELPIDTGSGTSIRRPWPARP